MTQGKSVKKKIDIKKLVMLGLLCAIAYIMVFVGRIPIIMFLKYDPKDIIIAMGGFVYGPLAAAAVSVVVSIIEMFTISTTGVIGCIMNILSTCSFACTAALIYKKKRNISGALIGLVAGCVTMTILMLFWNYLITPYHMLQPREAIAAMLLPIFLPFNLFKGGLNIVFTFILYKPFVKALRRSRILAENNAKTEITTADKRITAVVLTLILIVSVLLLLIMKDIL